MAWKVPGTFEEATEWFRKRISMTKADYDALDERERGRAFTVAGVAQLDIVTDVWTAIDKAIENGDDIDDFRSSIADALEAAWAGTVDDPAWRIETIFRTNLQSAYGAGRYAQATDPDVLEERPIWMFDAILDGRETRICHACDGTKLPADHPWWETHITPLHHNCRSGIVTLTQDEAGTLTKKPPKAKPDGGFGLAPSDDGTDLDAWAEEKLDAAPEPLAKVARERLKKTA